MMRLCRWLSVFINFSVVMNRLCTSVRFAKMISIVDFATFYLDCITKSPVTLNSNWTTSAFTILNNDDDEAYKKQTNEHQKRFSTRIRIQPCKQKTKKKKQTRNFPRWKRLTHHPTTIFRAWYTFEHTIFYLTKSAKKVSLCDELINVK